MFEKEKICKILDKYKEPYSFYINNKDTESATSVANKFNVDKKYLLKMIRQGVLEINNNLYLDNNALLNFIKIKEEYFNSDLNMEDLYLKYSIKRDTFKKYLKEIYNLEPKDVRLSYNRNIFSDIDTEEKAYWLGFILADGCIFRNELRIKLNSCDENHLMKFIEFINGVGEVNIQHEVHKSTKNILSKVVLVSKDIVNDLEKHGISRNKSTKEIPNINIDNNLVRHYIRGFFDGDGCITHDLKKIDFASSLIMNEYIKRTLIKNLNINDTKILNHGKITKYAIYNKTDKEKVLNYLYANSNIYLDRKYDLYRKFCRPSSTLQKN